MPEWLEAIGIEGEAIVDLSTKPGEAETSMATAELRQGEQTATDLSISVEALEAVEWTAVSEVSTVTVATFCRQLQRAKAVLD